jgi:CBS domain containing-hemolysin-like protein
MILFVKNSGKSLLTFSSVAYSKDRENFEIDTKNIKFSLIQVMQEDPNMTLFSVQIVRSYPAL